MCGANNKEYNILGVKIACHMSAACEREKP